MAQKDVNIDEETFKKFQSERGGIESAVADESVIEAMAANGSGSFDEPEPTQEIRIPGTPSEGEGKLLGTTELSPGSSNLLQLFTIELPNALSFNTFNVDENFEIIFTSLTGENVSDENYFAFASKLQKFFQYFQSSWNIRFTKFLRSTNPPLPRYRVSEQRDQEFARRDQEIQNKIPNLYKFLTEEFKRSEKMIENIDKLKLGTLPQLVASKPNYIKLKFSILELQLYTICNKILEVIGILSSKELDDGYKATVVLATRAKASATQEESLADSVIESMTKIIENITAVASTQQLGGGMKSYQEKYLKYKLKYINLKVISLDL